MQTWGKLLSAEEARSAFDEHWSPPEATERVATAGALGRVLAEALVSPEALPPYRRSLMDGFAVRSADLAEAPVVLPVQEDIQMGAAAVRDLAPGKVSRIPTGGMLPDGADAVIPIEATENPDADEVRFLEPIAAGRHLIEVGEDVNAGELLLASGHVLRPPDIGALTGLGLTEVSVYRRPRVHLISTGDEIVPPEESPPFGKVRDMNSYSLAAMVEAAGGIAVREGIISDEWDELRATALRALAEADVLILNAGSSVGKKDIVAPLIDSLGKPGVLVHGVDIRPGKPTVFAVCEGKPVFGLPGQPVSVINTFDVFVAPVLRRMQRLPEPRLVSAWLAEEIRSADGREDHIRVILEERDGEYWARPMYGVSAMISTMLRADGITVIPAGEQSLPQGRLVQVRLL